MGIERLLGSTAGTGDAGARRRPRRRHHTSPRGRPAAPHFKAHKSPDLMRRQLAGGTLGAGVHLRDRVGGLVAGAEGLHDDILVANESADPGRAASFAPRAADTRGSPSRSTALPTSSSFSGLDCDGPDRDQRRPEPLRLVRLTRSAIWRASAARRRKRFAACRAMRATPSCLAARAGVAGGQGRACRRRS